MYFIRLIGFETTDGNRLGEGETRLATRRYERTNGDESNIEPIPTLTTQKLRNLTLRSESASVIALSNKKDMLCSLRKHLLICHQSITSARLINRNGQDTIHDYFPISGHNQK